MKADLKNSLEFHMIYVSAPSNGLFKLYLKEDDRYSKQGRGTGRYCKAHIRLTKYLNGTELMLTLSELVESEYLQLPGAAVEAVIHAQRVPYAVSLTWSTISTLMPFFPPHFL
jgi:hypothetical protein